MREGGQSLARRLGADLALPDPPQQPGQARPARWAVLGAGWRHWACWDGAAHLAAMSLDVRRSALGQRRRRGAR